MSADKTQATRLADAPERIWLQVCDDADCVESFASHDGVTWCQDKVNDTDIEYVRSDRVAALENDIHSCHPGCKRAGCVNERLREAIEEQKRTIDALMCGMPDDGTTPVIRRIAALEAALEQARVALRDARASLHGHGYNKGIIAKVDAVLRAIEGVQHG